MNPKNIVFKSFSSTVRKPLGEKVILTISNSKLSGAFKISDNGFLNFRTNQVDEGWGYAVFGKVTEGIEVVDKIAAVQTTAVMGYQDVPTDTIKIISAEVLD